MDRVGQRLVGTGAGMMVAAQGGGKRVPDAEGQEGGCLMPLTRKIRQEERDVVSSCQVQKLNPTNGPARKVVPHLSDYLRGSVAHEGPVCQQPKQRLVCSYRGGRLRAHIKNQACLRQLTSDMKGCRIDFSA